MSSVGTGTVDWHTHAVPPDLAAPAEPGDYPWPTMHREDPAGDTRAVMWVGDHRYRELDDRSWSATRRLADMDADGVAVQVVSPIPIALCHDAPAGPAAAYAHAFNGFLAGLVAQAPDRFRALGAVPLQDPEAAVAELRHCVLERGFAGVEIGTLVGAGPDIRELADPALDPFFEAADELGAVVFVHPVDSTLDPRLAAAGLAFGVGMPTETAVAGAGLLTAGTLARRPHLRVCLAHGGGALPALLGRVTRGQELAAGLPPHARLDVAESARERVGALWCDSLTYDATSLRLVLDRVGDDHVVLGTDYPFAAREAPAGAVLADLGSALAHRVGRANGDSLLSAPTRLEPR